VDSSITPRKNDQRLRVAVAILSSLMALFAGWYVVALGWAVLFLLGESIPMVVYGVVLLAAPVLFTLVAIQSLRGKTTSALWLLFPFGVKWVAASVWAWAEGGFGEFLARLPGVSLVTMLEQGYQDVYPLEQFILVIAQFQVEPFAVIALVLLLWVSGRKTADGRSE
jgi:hypothetical protein